MSDLARLSDTTLAYEIAGHGSRLVWCHGLASCRDGDRDVIDELGEHFLVLAYDARGHGQSEPVRDATMFSYPALSRDLTELLDHVGWKDAVLTGASMGAATAARVAMEHPHRVRALVMARPGSDGSAAPERLQVLFRLGAQAIREGGLDAAIAFLLTIPEARDAIDREPGRVDRLRADWQRHDPLSIAAALEGIPPSPPLSPDLDPKAITAPTLVVPGNDAIHPTEAGIAVAAMIPTARAVAPFDSLPREEETRSFVGLIREFLRESGIQ